VRTRRSATCPVLPFAWLLEQLCGAFPTWPVLRLAEKAGWSIRATIGPTARGPASGYCRCRIGGAPTRQRFFLLVSQPLLAVAFRSEVRNQDVPDSIALCRGGGAPVGPGCPSSVGGKIPVHEKVSRMAFRVVPSVGGVDRFGAPESLITSWPTAEVDQFTISGDGENRCHQSVGDGTGSGWAKHASTSLEYRRSRGASDAAEPRSVPIGRRDNVLGDSSCRAIGSL